MNIGIFDSGYGGKYTLACCKSLLPKQDFIGFFDHKNAPYGERTTNEIFDLTNIGLNNLFDQNCVLTLIACNTACSQALPKLQNKYSDRKILGCLIPAVETALDVGGKRIGVIATAYTVNTKKYQREFFKLDQRSKVFPLATPKLVPWIEAGQHETSECLDYLTTAIEQLITEHQIDTLILGCTHYHLLRNFVAKTFPDLKLVDSASAQAEKLVDYLKRHPELE